MTENRKNQVVEVVIEKLTKRGDGRGQALFPNGLSQTVETAFTLPGDKILVEAYKKKRGVYSSKLLEILTPSPDRIAPKCAHFGVCGGCRFQHISIEKQSELKEQGVREAFKDLLDDSVNFLPLIASDHPFKYRNKMEFSFGENLAGEKFLGMMMDSGKGKVFNLTECHLVDEWFADAVKAVKKWWVESDLKAFHSHANTGSLRTLTVREGKRTGDRMIMLTVSGNPEYALKKYHLQSFVTALRESVEPQDKNKKFSVFLRIHQAAKGMTTNFYEMHLYGSDFIQEKLFIKLDDNEEPKELTFNISPTTFFQPNTAQAERLYATALKLAKIDDGAVVYDLFCGSGTLGICIASRAKQVIGLEISPESAIDARTNVNQNGLKNVTIITGAVRHTLGLIHSEHRFPLPDVIMVDPPRPGLDPDALKSLIEISPPTILYVSCNPVTQAENIKVLTKNGYRIESIQPVDQFPNTVHIENIAVLKRC